MGYSSIRFFRGGALTLERGMGKCRGHDPHFLGQPPLPSPPIYCQCAALVPLLSKSLTFQVKPVFSQNCSYLDPNFFKFSFPRPPFLKENPLPRPYILKPTGHTPTKKKKKKLSAPPPWWVFWKKYTSGPRYWNVPVLVNSWTFLVYQYYLKIRYLRSLECAGTIQKLTILECKNGLVLSNTRVPVSRTWGIRFPFFISLYSDGSLFLRFLSQG